MSTLLHSLAPSGLVLPSPLVEDVTTAYASWGRAYHTLRHVEDVATHFDEVAREVGWQSPREVYLAVLYHDAIYVSGAQNNESASAARARDAVAAWLAGEGIDADRVAELILATRSHGTTLNVESLDTGLFLDCDMAILGAPEAAFAAYSRGVAAEYAWLPRQHYLEQRAKFLSRLLSNEWIFLTSHFRDRLEARARANIQRELAMSESERAG